MADIKKPGKKIIILDIDGGGVLGLIPIHVLKKLEEMAGKSCSEIFTAFSGVSAGAIIVGALNMPGEGGEGFKYTAASFAEIFPSLMSQMFQRSLLYKIKTLWGLIGPIYQGESKQQAIEKLFGQTSMSQLKNFVSISATDFNDPSGIVFEVDRYFHMGVLHKDIDFYLKDTVNASTATPIFFPSVIVRAIDGKKTCNLVDGSIALNTQSLINMTAYIEENAEAEIHILSLGTHEPSVSKYDNVIDWGILKWGTRITELTISGTLRNSVDIVRFLFRHVSQVKQFVRLSPMIPPKIASHFSTNPKYLSEIADFADHYAKDCIPQLQEFLDKIAKSKI